MTTSEAIDVFKEYLTTKIVPRPIELIEASKVAIEVLTQQLEETDKQFQWKPSEEQMKHLERCFTHGHTVGLPNQHVLESLYQDLKKLM